MPRGDVTPEGKVSTDTEQAGHLGHLSLASPYPTGAPELGDLKVQVSTSASGEIRRVRQVLPTLPKFEEPPAEQFNIKDLVSNISRQVTKTVVGQLTRLSSSEAQADINIRQALAAARKKGPTATVSKPDNIQVILRAAKTRGLRTQTPERTATQTTCCPPVAPVQSQQEQEVVQRGCPGHWNPDPLGLQADITAQQREKGRERCTGSAKRRSGSRPQDEAKRGRQTPSSDNSEPAINWNKNKIGSATRESAGPQAPKSPAKTSRAPSSTQSNSQPAPRYSQSRPSSQNERKDEAACKEKSREAQKKLEEEIILKYPGYLHLHPDS